MEFLEDYKPVRAKLLYDQVTGKSKGTGFVEL